MRVEKWVAQQRCNALLLVGRDAVFHAMRPFVPLGRCITRVFGQVLFVDAVGANEPKGVHATLFGKCERVVGSQFAGQNQRTHGVGHAFAVGAKVFCGLIHLLTGHFLTVFVDIFKEVFLQFLSVHMFVAGQQTFRCRPPMFLVVYGCCHDMVLLLLLVYELTSWQVYEVTSLRVNKMASWRVDKMTSWRVNKMASWRDS